MTESDQTSLTPRREAFCRHVAEGLITAARLAGYAPGNARKTGHDLLRQPDISLRIPDLRNEAAGVRTWPRDDRGNRLPLFGDRECTRAPSLPSDLIFLDELQVVVQLFTISDTDMLIDTSLISALIDQNP